MKIKHVTWRLWATLLWWQGLGYAALGADQPLYYKLSPIYIAQGIQRQFTVLWDRTTGPGRWSGYAWVAGSTVAGSTAVLGAYDPEILNACRTYSERIGLLHPQDSGQETKVLVNFVPRGTYGLRLNMPHSLNSVFWFFGEGISAFALIAAFAGYGLTTNQSYAVETASQLIQGLVSVGLIVFPIKLFTGRESPARQTQPGGTWHFYPGLTTYLKDQPKYYSYPSGHTATLVTTMTILAQRYGSYPWIRPLGAGMTGLLMLSMLNNKTHWASDYPLAIAIGYNVGMSVTQPPEAYIKTTESKKFMWQSFEPHITPRFIGFHSTWKF